MKFALRQLAAAALLATLGFAASAQMNPPATPGAPGAMPHPGMREHMAGHFDPARMQEHMARREAALKQKLQNTPAQEGAWTAFTAAMRPPANWKRPDRAEIERLPMPERIDRMRALRTERNAMMDKRGEAIKTFYATLTPYQKGLFDSLKRPHGHRGGMGEMGGMGGPGGVHHGG